MSEKKEAGYEILPYGIFAGRYRTREGEDDIMVDWKPDQTDRLEKFKKWRREKMNFIRDNFFPENDPDDPRKWIGAARDFAGEMTRLELDLMVRELGFSHDKEVNDKNNEIYKFPKAGLPIENHLYHFKIEDDISIAAGENFNLYDPTLTDYEHRFMKKLAAEALGEADRSPTKGKGMFWFKFRLRRPRPHQAALWFNTPNFLCEIANTGFHSSAHSGHCLQGVLLGCAVLEGWLKNGFNIEDNPERAAALAQYMIDWGDRRIFAGVHYPTDNVISWWLAFQLIPNVFRDHRPIEQFLSEAIQKHSRIFEIVRDHFGKGPLQGVRDELLRAFPEAPSADRNTHSEEETPTV